MKSNIEKIINCLPEIFQLHSRNTKIYELLSAVASDLIKESVLSEEGHLPIDTGVFGKIVFPYTKMGAIDSLDLFGLDELIIFSYYWTNRMRYRNVADIGANIGLHSLLMSRCGWQVNAYEPDPVHCDLIKRNLNLNNVNSVTLFEAAVSDKAGSFEFTRVKGNTTGSHLTGSKKTPYGELDKFRVDVEAIFDIMNRVDFIKLDVEGHEAVIIKSTNTKDWEGVDMMLEVGSPENAEDIFKHLNEIRVNCFSQKNGWKRVSSIADMPIGYREGSLFISTKDVMNWVEL
jgi:FkbM family methyltransferase